MSAPEPLVSVIVPVYNVEAYLARCLESLLAQTHERLEIILVDDGSSDRSGTICDDYARADSRIRVLHQANAGPSAARNAGLDAMLGDFVTFVDSDDWVDARYVAVLLGLLTRWEAQVAACPFVRTTTVDPPRTQGPFAERVLTPDDVALEFFGANHTMWTIACAKLYTADLWRTMRFPDGRLHEDEFMTYRVVDQGVRSAATTEVLYFYFQHAASITGRPPTAAQRRDAMDAAREQVDFLRSGPGTRRLLIARAEGQLFRKQIYLRRQLAAEALQPDADLRHHMRQTAADLWRLEPGRPFAAFAQAYVRAPGTLDRAHRAITRVRRARRTRRSSGGRLRVLISSGWLGGAGGAERALHSYLHALAGDQVEVVVRHVLDGPLARVPAGVTVHPYSGWRWWAAGHRDGYQGTAIQAVVNPVRKWLSAPVDVHLRALSGPGLENAVRARLTLIIPSGDRLTPEVAGRYTYVAMQAPDNVRLAAGAPTVLLPPPVLPLPAPSAPGPALPDAYLLTVFNPYGAVKGLDDLAAFLDHTPLPIVWCHSTRTVDFAIPETIAQHPRVVHVDDPSPSQLRFLYEGCTAYVSFSRTEGFGWSIADALRYAPAVVAREIGVLTFPEARDYPVQFVTDFTRIDWGWVRAQEPPGGPRDLPWLTPAAFRGRLAELVAGRG